MARRSTALQIKVPFLPEVHIEHEADCMLAEYADKFEAVSGPPVPIEDMIEQHL